MGHVQYSFNYYRHFRFTVIAFALHTDSCGANNILKIEEDNNYYSINHDDG